MATPDEQERIEVLLENHLPSLRAFVRTRLRPELRIKESSSDLVQSVCRELLAAGDGFELRSENAFRAWLFTAALNKIRDRDRFYREAKRDMNRELDAQANSSDDHLLQGYASVCTPSHAVSVTEQVAILEQAMDELEPDHRDAIAYARLAGLQSKEIAPLMGRQETAVRALLGRALVKLAAQLKAHGLRPPGETL